MVKEKRTYLSSQRHNQQVYHVRLPFLYPHLYIAHPFPLTLLSCRIGEEDNEKADKGWSGDASSSVHITTPPMPPLNGVRSLVLKPLFLPTNGSRSMRCSCWPLFVSAPSTKAAIRSMAQSWARESHAHVVKVDERAWRMLDIWWRRCWTWRGLQVWRLGIELR